MKKTIVVMMVAAFSVTGLLASPSVENGNSEMVPKLCTISIQGTYDNKQININVTVEAENCAVAAGQLLKAAIATK
ncbi:MAG: hypothetical protein JNN04_07935 [Cyclobacteriaceae bacterium]|nr:hypothetical protein [Cyclobacteriaceae bacterium]